MTENDHCMDGTDRRLHSTFNVEARQCERCGYELKIAVYLNGQNKCGRCYGIEKGYYPESADRCVEPDTDRPEEPQ